MNRLARNPLLNLLLALAGLHQLGACPCGCLEHHGWSQLAEQLFAQKHAHPESPECVAESSDCDHVPRDLAIVSARVADDPIAVGVDGLAEPPLVDAIASALTRRQFDSSLCDSAPPVRAQHQVFRL